MYNQFYNFRESPFSLLPDPDFLFVSREHGAALNLLELAVLNHTGFCVISGEIGAGKTTIVRELLNRLDDQVSVGLITNTHASFTDLMRWILAAFELKTESEDGVFMHRKFTEFVTEQFQGGRHTLLIIDEAQNLSVAALEQLRMLSNINSGSDLLLQVILVGQRELREKLARPELEQFSQRISIDYFLRPLGETEAAAYIAHRVEHAGGSNPLFDPEACARIYRYSGGIPRVINRLCDLSLVYGYAENARTISANLVDAVVAEHKFSRSDTGETTAVPAALKTMPVVNNKKDTEGSAMEAASQKKQRKAVRPAKVEIEIIPADQAVKRREESERLAAEKAARAVAAVETAAADLAALQQAGAMKLAAEQQLVEVVSADENASQQAATAKSAAETAVSERAAAEADVLEKKKVAELAVEKAKVEMATAEKQVAQKLDIEEEAMKAALQATAAAEKALAEKVAAEKMAAEAAAASEALVKEASESRVAAETEVANHLLDTEQAAELALNEQHQASQAAVQAIASEKAARKQAHDCAADAKEKAAERVEVLRLAETTTSAAKKAQTAADASRVAAEQAVAEQTEAEKEIAVCATVEKVALASVAAEKAEEALKAAETADVAKEAALKEAEEKKAAAAAAAEFAAKARAAADKAAGVGENEAEGVVEVQSIPLALIEKPAIKELLADRPVVMPDAEAQRQSKPGRAWAAMAVTAIVAGSAWFVIQPYDSASNASAGAADKAVTPLQYSTDIVVETAAIEISESISKRGQ